MINTLDTWLRPFIDGVSRISQLKNIDLKSAIEALFTWENRQKIKIHAPSHIVVPSGSKIPLRYTMNENGTNGPPVLAVRLQELFGLEQTPCLANGKIPVSLHLLSPASRPVQVTTDLKSFWKNTYRDVKKELMGRYPKHYWPDHPLTAVPTSKTKKNLPPAAIFARTTQNFFHYQPLFVNNFLSQWSPEPAWNN